MSRPNRGSAWPGILWIVWCAAMFVGAMGGAQLVLERAVIPDLCGRECVERGSTFAQLRIGGRGGPPAACVCADGTAIDSSMQDVGTGIGAIVFLAGCYLPLAIFARRQGRADRAGGDST